ncbi:hypothetical protein ZWY2020_042382 [Hordeum vulgare]|nr:hypothetical protein ZWY2020_042382 [Hordeum vulgare]
MDHAGGSSSGGGGDPKSNWPNSLDQPAMEELHRLGLLVPLGCRLAKPWRVSKDGYPTKGDPPTAEELCTHRGGRYNSRGLHAFWDGKSYYAIVAQLRPRRRAAVPQPPPAAPSTFPPVPEEVDLPPEQVVLREDGDPDDTPGLLVALRASQAAVAAAATTKATREEAEIASAIQAAHAMGAADLQPVAGDDDDDVDWDGLAVSSDDDDGSDGGGAGVGQDVVYVDEFE